MTHQTKINNTKHLPELVRIVRANRKLMEEDRIERLPNHRGVKLSSTLSGQRELIREMRNKINLIIEVLNKKEK